MNLLSAIASKLKTYDTSMEYYTEMYDKLPYVRDWNYCNESTIALYSGNHIKYYRCIVAEPVLIDNQDDLTATYLEELQEQVDSKKSSSASALTGTVEDAPAGNQKTINETAQIETDESMEHEEDVHVNMPDNKFSDNIFTPF